MFYEKKMRRNLYQRISEDQFSTKTLLKKNIHPNLSIDNTVDGQNPAPHLNERNPFPNIISDTFRSFRMVQDFVRKKHLPKISENKNLAKQIETSPPIFPKRNV